MRSQEQVQLLRALWAQPTVTYSGRWHRIQDAGIKPLPARRRIPVWFGGNAEATLRRVGRLGDGWLPQRGPDQLAREMVDRIRAYAQEAGRAPTEIGVEPRLTLARVREGDRVDFVTGWRALGATHLCVNTMGLGLATADSMWPCWGTCCGCWNRSPASSVPARRRLAGPPLRPSAAPGGQSTLLPHPALQPATRRSGRMTAGVVGQRLGPLVTDRSR